MVQNPSWETNSLSMNQGISLTLCNPKFITVFGRARHVSLYWDSWIQSTKANSVSLGSVLIVCSHLLLGIPRVIYSLQAFQPKYCTQVLSLPCALHIPPSYHHWFDGPNIWWRVKLWSFSLCSTYQATVTSSHQGPNIHLRSSNMCFLSNLNKSYLTPLLIIIWNLLYNLKPSPI